MNEQLPQEPPLELDDFTIALLTLATDIVVPKANELVAFGLIEFPSGERSVQRIVASTLEESLTRARMVVASNELARFVGVAWDGYLTTGSGRSEAVYVEVAERGSDTSFIVAQRYGRRGLLKRTTFVDGRPVLAGNGNLYG